MKEFTKTKPEKSIDELLTDTAKMLRAKFTKAPLLIYTDAIKEELRYFPKRPKGDESAETRFIPVGVVLEDAERKKYFRYTSLYTLDKNALTIALSDMNPIEIYCNVSFEAFLDAENLFRAKGDLGKVYKHLTISEQDRKKLAHRSMINK